MAAKSLECPLMINFVIGVIGNGFMVSFLRDSLRSTHAYNFNWTFTLLNLSVANLVTSFSGIVATYTNYSLDVHPAGPWGDMLCKLFTSYSVTWMCTNVSVMQFCVLTWERYSAVARKKGMRPNNRRSIRIVSTAVWIIGCLMFLPYVPFQFVENGECVEDFPSYTFHVVVTWSDTIVFFVLPVLFYVFSYCGILRALNRNRRKVGTMEFHGRTRRAVTRTTLFILISFVCCWAPSYLCYTVQTMYREEPEWLSNAVEYSFFVALLAHSLQPLIFACNNRTFRTSIRSKLIAAKDFCCCSGLYLADFDDPTVELKSLDYRSREARQWFMRGVVHLHCEHPHYHFNGQENRCNPCGHCPMR